MATSLIVDSPLGPLRLVAEEGALVAVWLPEEADVPETRPGLRLRPSTPAFRTSARDARTLALPLGPNGSRAELAGAPFAPSGGPAGRGRGAGSPLALDPVLQRAADQLAAWFRGDLRTFDLPLQPPGTPFQRAVWAELRRIPFGETRTYGDIATALGRPSACRAVGAANGRNPISIIVPCHRVIGATGALTGYAGGLARKRWLLDHERAVLAR